MVCFDNFIENAPYELFSRDQTTLCLMDSRITYKIPTFLLRASCSRNNLLAVRSCDAAVQALEGILASSMCV